MSLFYKHSDVGCDKWARKYVLGTVEGHTDEDAFIGELSVIDRVSNNIRNFINISMCILNCVYSYWNHYSAFLIKKKI